MNYFILKIIAILAMTIDHFAYSILRINSNVSHSIYSNLRYAGRIAFPLFAFLLVNGYYHTKNNKKYLLRLMLFAIISEIPFDLCFYDNVFILKHQNIYFTLSLGLFLIIFLDYIRENISNKYIKIILQFFFIFLVSLLNNMLKSDYGFTGILLIILFYFTYNKNINQLKFGASISLTLFFLIDYISTKSTFEKYSLLSLIFILLFKEKNIKVNKFIKIFFYMYYPIHLIFLYLLRHKLYPNYTI